MKEMHPVEKLMRIGLGSLTVEGLPRGRYRLLPEKEVEALRASLKAPKKEKEREKEKDNAETQRPQRQRRDERPSRNRHH
jgi:hypothetical protein